MLTLELGGNEIYNEKTEEFETRNAVSVRFEHSLVSLSKWEAKYEKPFLGEEQKTPEETLDYVRLMLLDERHENLLLEMNESHVQQINTYIDAKMSATWFTNEHSASSRNHEIITNEIIYYWMIALTIPFECQHWHLNRLLTLIRVCNQKNAPKQKIPMRELAARNRDLNAQRRAKMNSSG